MHGFFFFLVLQFVWARVVVLTRVFGVRMHGRKTSALVPLADTLRHGRECCKWSFDNDSNSFVIEASRPLKAGEMINVSFGKKCNSRFLLNYGFTQPNNPWNQVRATFLTFLSSHLLFIMCASGCLCLCS